MAQLNERLALSHPLSIAMVADAPVDVLVAMIGSAFRSITSAHTSATAGSTAGFSCQFIFLFHKCMDSIQEQVKGASNE